MIKLQKSEDGQYYFTVCGKNGRVLTTSETYTRKQSAIDGIGKSIGISILAANLYNVEVKDVNIIDLTGE